MSNYRKFELLVFRGMLSCVFALFLPVGFMFLNKMITGSEDLKTIEFIALFCLGLIVSSIYGYKNLKKDILKSRTRLENQSYVSELKKVGLIK